MMILFIISIGVVMATNYIFDAEDEQIAGLPTVGQTQQQDYSSFFSFQPIDYSNISDINGVINATRSAELLPTLSTEEENMYRENLAVLGSGENQIQMMADNDYASRETANALTRMYLETADVGGINLLGASAILAQNRADRAERQDRVANAELAVAQQNLKTIQANNDEENTNLINQLKLLGSQISARDGLLYNYDNANLGADLQTDSTNASLMNTQTRIGNRSNAARGYNFINSLGTDNESSGVESSGVMNRNYIEGTTGSEANINNSFYTDAAGNLKSNNRRVSMILGIESGGNSNAVSSTGASGAGQITSSTLNSYNRANGTNLTDRTDNQTTARVMSWLISENEKTLTNMGIPVNDATTYMAYNVGTGTTAKLYRGDLNNFTIDDKVNLFAQTNMVNNVPKSGTYPTRSEIANYINKSNLTTEDLVRGYRAMIDRKIKP